MKINEIISSVDKDEILKIFNKYFTYDGKITIDANGFISCSGNIKLIRKLSKLPVKFLKIDGDFYCYDNQLTTLEGGPTSVGGGFYCSENQLTTLVGGPTSVGDSFYCSNNQLTTLEGSPTSVGGSFNCSSNQLTTLECSPTSINGNFYCFNNPNLKNLNHLPSGISELWMPYSPTMPLLRCLIAKEIRFDLITDTTTQIKNVLNKYAEQGRKAALDCAADLLSLGKKLGIDLTMNVRW